VDEWGREEEKGREIGRDGRGRYKCGKRKNEKEH